MILDDDIIAREEERKLLLELYNRKSSELISITGRRRVGKTFLVDTLFEGKIDFRLEGVQNEPRQHQLYNFGDIMAKLRGTSRAEATPENWQFAFFSLVDYLETIDKEEKLLVFFDELPWLATHKSKFLSAFSYFWNSWAVRRNIMVIICGSAASWINNKVVRHKGGLHNRLTKRIHLEPFNLYEVQKYLISRNFDLSVYDITEIYMTLGGIPFYLNEVLPNLSVAENIDRLMFSPNGMLHDEFSRLYPALFDNSEGHIEVVKALSAHFYGLDRQQIIKLTSLTDGGGTTKILEELEFSGFIKEMYVYGKKSRYRRYRLIDEYSNFYLKFIEPNKRNLTGWEDLRGKQNYITWRGYAFENLGLRHINQIKKALGISGVSTAVSTFYHKGNDFAQGLQVDLLIERADRAINLCEFKFYNKLIDLSSGQVKGLRDRKQAFRQLTGTDHTLFTSLISPYGINPKSNKGGVVNQSITLEDLFEAQKK